PTTGCHAGWAPIGASVVVCRGFARSTATILPVAWGPHSPLACITASSLLSGENAPAKMPCYATEAFVCSMGPSQFLALPDDGTLLEKDSSPKLAPLFLVPSTRTVEPSGDQLICPPSAKPGALVHVVGWE